MKKLLFALLFFSALALAQPPGGGGLPNVSTLLTPCQTTGTNVTVYKTTTTIGPYYCGADHMWHALTGGTVSAAFNVITSGTNTTATMTVGSGATFTFSGSGIINANRLMSVALSTLTGVIKMASGVPSVVTGNASDCVHVDGGSASCPSGGTGDVVGPSSAVDSSLVLYDSTTGKLIKAGSQCTVVSGVLNCPAFSAGGPTITGTGVIGLTESTGQTCPAASVDCLIADSGSHLLKISNNNGTAFPVTQTIFHGTKALATGAISSAACTSAQTVTATGTLTTDIVTASFNGDPTAVTGYVPLTAGMLTIITYPTADTVNIKVCNNTTSSITPGAITLNVAVNR